MTPEEFVTALRVCVHEPTIAGVQKQLAKPAGRAPAKDLLEMSAWYRGLAEPDRAMLQRVIAFSSDMCLFGTLCVLDGAKVIEDPKDRGELVLEHVSSRGRVRLNGEGVSLHDCW